MDKKEVLNRFNYEQLNSEIKLVNDLLANYLELKMAVKESLIGYFKTQKVGLDEFKTFNLERWCGGEVNPTLEIVEVDGRFLFGMTHYGILGPLTYKEFISHKERFLCEILKFFADPQKYFEKNHQR